MKKHLRTIIALIFAAVLVLAFPLTAGATLYSGMYNNIYYTCSSNGNSALLNGNLTTGTSTKLDVIAEPDVYYRVGNTIYHWSNAATVFKHVNDGTSANINKTYNSYYQDHSDVLTYDGYFKKCVYTFKIIGHTVESWTDFYV